MPEETQHRSSGGSANAGGVNYQAAVTAVVLTYLSTGSRLNWLEDLADDTPVRVEAETGGPGDDLRIIYRGGEVAEVQVKGGLKADDRLWSTLRSLTCGLEAGKADFGILVVSPDSSGSVREDLARDIERLGQGRADGLKEITQKMLAELRWDAARTNVCKRLRIVVGHADAASGAWSNMCRTELTRLCRDRPDQAEHAWRRLCADGSKLMRMRGARGAADVVRLLRSSGIDLTASGNAPALVLNSIVEWTKAVSSSYTILGFPSPLDLNSAWLPVLTQRLEEPASSEGLAGALKKYHTAGAGGRYSDDIFDAQTTGRFFARAVVIGGPGMGKTTLLRKIQQTWASEGQPVLRVRLPELVARMRGGATFTESVFQLALDGCGVSPVIASAAGIQDWLLLCDGLDECANDQEWIIDALLAFLAGHPRFRIIVATRPIGYRSVRLRGWQHYELVPIEKDRAIQHIEQLIDSTALDEARKSWAKASAAPLFARERMADFAGRSPLLLGLATSLLLSGRTLAQTRHGFYAMIFEQLLESPSPRHRSVSVSSIWLNRVIDIVGWTVLNHPLSPADAILKTCADQLANESREPPIVARQKASDCLDFWQSIGLIERVSHEGDDTLTFVHQTFAEYAAARYLAALGPKEQLDAIAATFASAAWAEVWTFAAGMGLVEPVSRALLASQASVSPVERASRLLTLMRDAEEKPSAETVRSILDLAAGCIASDDRHRAAKVGRLVRQLGSRYSAEVGERFSAMRTHPQAWTRLAAWTCALSAGPAYYGADELREALKSFPIGEALAPQRPLAGGLQLPGEHRKLAEDFVVAACSAILEHAPADADTVLPPVVIHAHTGSWSFGSALQNLLSKYGKAYDLGLTKSFGSVNFDIERMQSTMHDGLLRTMSAMAGDHSPRSNFDTRRIDAKAMYSLAAFLKLVGFWQLTPYETSSWRLADEIVSEVLRATCAASVISYDQLTREATDFKALVEASDRGLMGPFHDLPRVDVPELNWSRLAAGTFDTQLLEGAVASTGGWLIPFATYALVQVLPESRVPDVVARLLALDGDTLWTAAKLAQRMPAKTAQDLLIERLKQPSEGCEHLLGHLTSAPEAILRDALFSEHCAVASAAADLALKSGSGTALGGVLDQAFVEWRRRENSYEKTIAIPPSPRPNILRAQWRLVPPSDAELLLQLGDVRTDVVDVAKPEVAQRLSVSDSFRSFFLTQVEAGIVDGKALHEALTSKTPFSVSDIERIVKLTSSENARLRWHALGVLDAFYLSTDRVNELASLAASDPEIDIRDAAVRIRARNQRRE